MRDHFLQGCVTPPGTGQKLLWHECWRVIFLLICRDGQLSAECCDCRTQTLHKVSGECCLDHSQQLFMHSLSDSVGTGIFFHGRHWFSRGHMTPLEPVGIASARSITGRYPSWCQTKSAKALRAKVSHLIIVLKPIRP